MYKTQKGFGFIGVLLTLVIIGVLYMIIARVYVTAPKVNADKETQKAMADQGFNAQNLSGIVDKARQAADKANEVIKKQEQEQFNQQGE